MSSIAPTNNSAVISLFKSTNQPLAATSKQSAASQILSSISGVNTDPLKQAEGEITRILLESGGQFIIGGAFSSITGTDKNDIVYAGPGSSVDGGDGDDIISGSVQMHISGGAGNDTISVSGDSTIDGGDGDDTLFAGGGSSILGGAGNDLILGNVGNTITGGTGNDKITIGGNDARLGSTIKFAAGDGQDSITLLRSSSTLELGEGFTAANTKVTISDNKATISFDGNETDGIAVDFYLGSALALSFSDGSALEISPPGATPTYVSSYREI
jgi:Ca2+-binding RTX toxin-like protein